MEDHQGRLGPRAVRRSDHSGKAAQTNRVGLQHGAHPDGPDCAGGTRPALIRPRRPATELSSETMIVARACAAKELDAPVVAVS